MNNKIINELFKNKKILILGFGLEGKSSYNFIRNYFPDVTIGIADKKNDIQDIFKTTFKNEKKIIFHTGADYLNYLFLYDVIVKSPGISYKKFSSKNDLPLITTQAEIFLRLFRDKIIGVTGTKGKSTTSSIIYNILKLESENVILVGNIGVPPLDKIAESEKCSWIVFELSSHQLENLKISPHIAILLNIFEEHLDHYKSYNDYQTAKFNIFKYQNKSDSLIFNSENNIISDYISKTPVDSKLISIGNDAGNNFCYLKGNDIHCNGDMVFKDISKSFKLAGKHNLINIMAAISACKIAGADKNLIKKGVSEFTGLPHRLEFIGNYGGIDFYNDSIATIPEATIEAVENVPNLSTVIIGGYDRGVNYEKLAECLKNSSIKTLIFIGAAGDRICKLMQKKINSSNTIAYNAKTFEEAVKLSIKNTPKNKSCLLSPAAASYDMFTNFEERGKKFQDLIINYFK